MRAFHLGWFLGPGITVQGWNTPNFAKSYDWTKPDIFRDGARRLEQAFFDFIILEDTSAVPYTYGGNMDFYLRHAAMTPKFDPLIVTPYILEATKKIGVATTLTTTFYPPWILARSMATLDHYSNGRVAWNIVTATSDAAAQNFGYDKQFEHDRRYDMADEFIDLVNQLWDAWAPDAVVNDDNMFIDPTKVKAVNFEGQYYKSRGPLNLPRSPQGRPLFVAPGGSPRGRKFSGRNAEVVLGSAENIEEMKQYCIDVRNHAVSFGRDPDKVKLMFAIAPVITKTRQEAEEYKQNYPKMLEKRLEHSLAAMSFLSGIDFAKFDLDAPVGEIKTNGMQTILGRFKDPNTTLRQIATSTPRWPIVGTAEDVAAEITEAMEEVGGDGYLITGHLKPSYVSQIVDELVPVLQKRGATRREYSHDMLRDNVMAF
jgi:FMN-dependent oxidoreductase (nitrilotriacetate monooxygenase family)